MALVLVEGGGVQTPPFLEKVLKLRKLSLFISIFAAVYYSQLFFLPENMEQTRISEHALMPGLVTSKFDKEGLIIQIFRELNSLGRSKPQQEFICEYFEKWDLSCDEQNWRTNVAAVNASGKNVYGWVRGSRTDGTEAQLVAVELGKSEEKLKMISQVMAFANYAKDQVYWARDIVFVFIDGGDLSLETSAIAFDAFLMKYHMKNSDSNQRDLIIADPIHKQCGVLIAGIVYNTSPVRVQGRVIMTAQMNGINGQQANLDLFNSAAKIANQKHQARMMIYSVLQQNSMEPSYLTPLRAVHTQAFVAIEGLHSVMGKYGVQGLTIGLSNSMRSVDNGKFIEAICRMLNNVLERLHQSYFMYILGDDIHFSSIAFYIPVIFIIALPLLISVYFEWRNLLSFSIPSQFLFLHFFGFLTYSIVTWAYINIGKSFVFQSSSWPFVGPIGSSNAISPPIDIELAFLAIQAIPLGFMAFLRFKPESIGTVRILCQLETIIFFCSLSLLNFGLAVFCSFVVTPIVFIVTFDATTRISAIVRTIVLLVASPMVIITSLAINSQIFFEYPQVSNESFFDLKLALNIGSRMIREHILLGSNHFALLCIFGIPLWNMLFASAMHFESGKEQKTEEKTKVE